jgi:hypothetical protein
MKKKKIDIFKLHYRTPIYRSCGECCNYKQHSELKYMGHCDNINIGPDTVHGKGTCRYWGMVIQDEKGN